MDRLLCLLPSRRSRLRAADLDGAGKGEGAVEGARAEVQGAGDASSEALIALLRRGQLGRASAGQLRALGLLHSRRWWQEVERQKNLALNLSLTDVQLRSVASEGLRKAIMGRGRAAPLSVDISRSFHGVGSLGALLEQVHKSKCCDVLIADEASEVDVSQVLASMTGEAQCRITAAESETTDEGLKFEVDFLSQFATVSSKSIAPLRRGKWYYEVELDPFDVHTVAQIGWADVAGGFKPNEANGSGTGDDKFSWGYDGTRKGAWHGEQFNTDYGFPWSTGDVVGCLANLDGGVIGWSLSGDFESPMGIAFENVQVKVGLTPSLTAEKALNVPGVTLRVNFGPNFRFPPPEGYRPYSDWLECEQSLTTKRAITNVMTKRPNTVLRQLSFARNGIDGSTLASLCRSFPALKSLNLSGNIFSDVDCSILASSLPKGLESLRLGRCGISEEGIVHLAKMIAVCCPNLMDLSLNDNHFHEQGSNALAVAIPQLKKLSRLDLSKSHIHGVNLMKAIVSISTSLRDVNLSGNLMEHDESEVLAAGLSENETILGLDLRHSAFMWHSAMREIAVGLQPNTCLQRFYINGVEMHEDGWGPLSAVFEAPGSKISELVMEFDERPPLSFADIPDEYFIAVASSTRLTRASIYFENNQQMDVFASSIDVGSSELIHLTIYWAHEGLSIAPLVETARKIQSLELRSVAPEASLDERLFAGADFLYHLESLGIFCQRIEGTTSFIEFASKCPNLKHLQLNSSGMRLDIIRNLLNCFSERKTIQSLAFKGAEDLTTYYMAMPHVLAFLKGNSRLKSFVMFESDRQATLAHCDIAKVLLDQMIALNSELRKRFLSSALLNGKTELTSIGLKLARHHAPFFIAAMNWIGSRWALEGSLELLSSKMAGTAPLKLDHDNFSVSGNLTVSNWKSEVIFPDHTPWKGNCVRISSCPLLQSLPAGMSLVNLILKDLPQLESLPFDLKVTGSIVLEKLPLIEVVSAMQPRESIIIRDCTSLRKIEAMGELRILRLVELTSLERLPSPINSDMIHFENLPLIERFPDDLSSKTLMIIRKMPMLKCLPRDGSVNNLDVQNCPKLSNLNGFRSVETLSLHQVGITSLPESLRLENLSLHDIPRLKKLPDDLRVTEALDLKNCALTTLPRMLAVEAMRISQCKDIELPEGLRVKESLLLERCGKIKNLPISVRPVVALGVVHTPLESIPQKLRLQQFSLRGCYKIDSLPHDLSVSEDFTLEDSEISRLPKMQCRNCVLTRCKNLDSLEGIKVSEGLVMEDCGIEQVPEGTVVDHLAIQKCANLLRLPRKLKCRLNLHVVECPELEELPESLSVHGDISFASLPKVTALPRQIGAGGMLFVAECDALRELPYDIAVETLILHGNQNLTRIPSRVRAHDVSISRCTSLSSLSDSFLRSAHAVQLGLNGLLEVERGRIERFCEENGIQITFIDDREEERVQKLSTLKEAVEFWRKVASGRAQIPDSEFDDHEEDEEEEEKDRHSEMKEFVNEDDGSAADELELEEYVPSYHVRDLLQFLTKLQLSAEFKQKELRQGLAARVLEILRTIRDSPATREEILVHISDSLTSCADKLTWAMNHIYASALTARARGDREALKDLGMRLMRLAIVEKHARNHPNVAADDVCVHLFYEIALREELDLPVSAEKMLFPKFVRVTRQQLDAAKMEALSVTEEQLDEWLKQWSEWQRHLRLQVARGIRWNELKRGRLDKRSSMRAFSGDPMKHPVMLGNAGPYEFDELMQRYIDYGTDFFNHKIAQEDLQRNLRRLEPPEQEKDEELDELDD